jgi:hypothetical protein
MNHDIDFAARVAHGLLAIAATAFSVLLLQLAMLA